MEYPLRPPIFALGLFSDSLKPSFPDTKSGILDLSGATVSETSSFKWYNELRAMATIEDANEETYAYQEIQSKV